MLHLVGKKRRSDSSTVNESLSGGRGQVPTAEQQKEGRACQG